MLTTNAWILTALFAVFVVGIIASVLGTGMYFGNPPAINQYPYWFGLLIILALAIAFIVGCIKFLHGIYGIDAYHEDIYFGRIRDV